MLTFSNKSCHFCGTKIHGRADKKFCDDHCRTSFNNRMKNDSVQVRNINHILRRNRSILERIIRQNKGEVQSNTKMLTDLGFNFAYHTHVFKSRSGACLKFCYEFGYQKLDSGKIILMQIKEEYPEPFG